MKWQSIIIMVVILVLLSTSTKKEGAYLICNEYLDSGIDYPTYGYVIEKTVGAEEGTTYEDYCHSDTVLVEYWCEGYQPRMQLETDFEMVEKKTAEEGEAPDIQQAPSIMTFRQHDCALEGFVCREGQCQECIPDCTNKECGDDGCGGSCGTCAEGRFCENYICVSPIAGTGGGGGGSLFYDYDSFYDIYVDVEDEVYSPGSVVYFTIMADFQPNTPPKSDVELNYYLVDSEGNIYSEKTEMIKHGDHNITRTRNLPFDAVEGQWGVVVNWDEINVTDSFEVAKKDNYTWMLLLGLIIIFTRRKK